MRFITPSERLVINSMEDAYRMKRLPSVVIIQRHMADDLNNEASAYILESRDWKNFIELTSNRPDTTDMKEEAAKKLGHPIAVETFENAIAYQVDCRHFNDGSAYSIFATKFKRRPPSLSPESVD